MKNVVKILALLVSAGIFSSCTINRPAEQVKTITVNGSGFVVVSPDTAEVDFTVTTSGWSAKQISADNDTISAKFMNAVQAVGVNSDDVTRSDIVITNPGNSYEAKRTVKVVTRNVNLVPLIVDAKTPSIKLTDVEYFANDSASEIRRARTAAIQNAQDTAGLLAGASGSRAGIVTEISDEKITKTVLADGKIKIQSDLTATYQLE